MTDEIRYKVGVFTVEMTTEHGVPIDYSCECEEWSKNQADVMLKTQKEERCRHIREAEMYHHYKDKVTLVETE